MIGQWWIVFLSIVIRDSFGFQCPEGHACSCQTSHTGDFEIHCPTENNSAFIVNIQPGEYIQVLCRNSPEWSDFQLEGLSSTRNVKSMYFRMCGLPSNISLGQIAHRLGAEKVERLIFQSFGNLSTTLTKEHLNGFPNLKKLILSSNSITYFHDDIFADVSNLTWLDLRENNVHLTAEVFKKTPELEILELGNNMIEYIEPGTFDKLSKLQLLNLWKNRLSEIKPGTFDKLVSLKSLDVNTNDLTTLPEDIFAKLEKLETLNLFANNFSSLPERLLQHNANLKTVNLYNNKQNLTTFPRGLFSNLNELKIIKLKRNGLRELPEDLFWGSSSITNVSLERNYLTTLPGNIFKDTQKLVALELSFNDITSLPDEIFASTPKLIKLDLSKNQFTSISRYLFSGLKELQVLNMEENQLKLIHELSFNSLTSLRIARFSKNFLQLNTSMLLYQDEYGTKSPFHDCTSLEELYLAKNNISEIFSDWTVSSTKLRILDLKYNQIPEISTEDLQFVSSNIKVDLTYNNIQRIRLNSAEQLASFQESARDVVILVENNPILCDCSLYDFLRYLEGRMHPRVQNYFHIIPGNLKCKNPEWMSDIFVTDLNSKSLRCIMQNSECPDKCMCLRRPDDTSFMVDCSYRNLTHVPSDIKNLPNHHLVLNLTGNALTSIPPLTEIGLDPNSVSMLLLSNNNISDIPASALSTNIQILELHNNNISKVSSDVLQLMKNSSSLANLTLHGNPWRCDCDARDFLNFIQTKVAEIPNSLLITCDGLNTPILKMTATDFCPVETAMIVGISLAIAFTGLIIGMLAAAYYRYQREIKVWLYAHQSCLWLVTEDELDKDKQYDAFISYSHKDEEFVVNELVRKLESGPRPFKLCLHFRDWLAGEWIPTQIARSVEDSRRTIVILSPNFLESVWGRMEFRAAHSQALSEGRARVILILYGEIGPTDDLDPELKAYLSMNTYVKWGDPWFWDKLRYALPHPPELTKTAIKKKIFEKHQPCIEINGDKRELIYPSGIPDTPPAATTPPADALKVFICDEKNAINAKDKPKESLTSNGTINGNNKLILTPEQLIKNNSIINKIQCTTV